MRESPDDDVMTLETSDSLTGIFARCILRPHLKRTAFLVRHEREVKRNHPRYQEEICETAQI